jgi:hypothetical protein
MAQAIDPLAGELAPITLLYVRATAEPDILGSRLAQIVARYAPAVTLQIVTPDQLSAGDRHSTGPLPKLVVLRRGEVITEACGALPVRELNRVVQRAVEWPE